jgi:hypothetical protein
MVDAEARALGDFDLPIHDWKVLERELVQHGVGAERVLQDEAAGRDRSYLQARGKGRRPAPQVGREAQLMSARQRLEPERLGDPAGDRKIRRRMSTARNSIRSRKSRRVNSDSPLAIGMSVAARTATCDRVAYVIAVRSGLGSVTAGFGLRWSARTAAPAGSVELPERDQLTSRDVRAAKHEAIVRKVGEDRGAAPACDVLRRVTTTENETDPIIIVIVGFAGDLQEGRRGPVRRGQVTADDGDPGSGRGGHRARAQPERRNHDQDLGWMLHRPASSP